MDSLSCSLALLQMDNTDDGPISRLPKELVQSILIRVDMEQLIGLQAVCQKWRAVICLIFHTKKSLYVTKGCRDDDYVAERLMVRSFGKINLAKFTRIEFDGFSIDLLASQIVKLFPNIESLALDHDIGDIHTILTQLSQRSTSLKTLIISSTFYSTRIDDPKVKLLNLINSFDSIKQLDLRDRFGAATSILAPTLARLELFTYDDYDESLVGQFSSNCSHVSLNIYSHCARFAQSVAQWHTISAQWLASVTHLELIGLFDNDERNCVLDITDKLGRHAVALQVLRLKGLRCACTTRMTAQLIGNLAKLKHVTELYLDQIIFDLPQLDKIMHEFKLAQLVSLRKCTLSMYKLVSFIEPEVDKQQSHRFASVLSAIFPNVVYLLETTMAH